MQSNKQMNTKRKTKYRVKSQSVSCSVASNSLWPHGLSPPGSSVHGIHQTRILEWVAIPISRGSSQSRDQTWVSCIAGRFFTIWTKYWARACVCVCIHIHTYKDWGNASISQETPKLPADHQKPSVIYKTDSLEQTVQEIRPANTLTLDFWPPELWGWCYSSHQVYEGC